MSQGSEYSDCLAARLLVLNWRKEQPISLFRSTEMGSEVHPAPYRKGNEGFPRE